MRIVRIKEIVDRTGNTVHLTECTDTEQTDTDAKKCKHFCEPCPLFTHSLFNIIERTTETVSILGYDAVFDRQQTLGILGSHT